MMTPVQQTVAVAPTTHSMRDFPEWLSPILVKELRQGMRSRLFVLSFLLLHGAMILTAGLALSVAAAQGPPSAMSGLFWTIVAVPLLIVMPLSALGSVANERKANSLELIFLTRVTPRRILLGKWLAIVAQTVLLVCLILPYAVLRYFLGGIDVTGDLLTLALLLLGSALLSGVAVGLSPQLSRVLRVVLIFGAVLFLQAGWPYLVYGGFGGSAGVTGAATAWHTYVGLLLLAVLLLFTMIELGAAKIAPLAANHSTSRRLIALAAILVTAVFGGIESAGTPLLPALIVLLTPICIGALCEMPSTLTATYRPFLRRGLAGRLAGRLLYPGWPSGVLFCLLVLALLFGPAYYAARSVVDPPWIWWTGMTIAGALLVPAAVNYTFFARLRRPLVIYLAVQLLCLLLAMMAGMMFGFGAGDFRAVVATIPASGLFLSQSGAINSSNIQSTSVVTSIITLGAVALLLLKMRKPWREMRALESAAAATPPRVTDAAEPRPAH